MGGKKKTKWRKLPLDEFTNDYSRLKKRKNCEESKLDSETKEENISKIPSNENVEENSIPYNPEYPENLDAMWYPTHYLIYNPVDVPLYTNFAVPADSNYYYYPSNEINPAPEYASLPYQEYIPPMKDTIYLVFPASALRPPQYSSFDWRNRRRRRRYNGYAEYAVIPEKTSNETKCSEKNGTNPNTDINNTQLSLDKISQLCSDKKDLTKYEKISIQNLHCNKEHNKFQNISELEKNMVLPKDEKRMPSAIKSKKTVDSYEVHDSTRRNSKSKDSTSSKDPKRKRSSESVRTDKELVTTFDILIDVVVDVPGNVSTDNPPKNVVKTDISDISQRVETISPDKKRSNKNKRGSLSKETSPTYDSKTTDKKNGDIEKQSDNMKGKTEITEHTDSGIVKDIENNNADTESLSKVADIDELEPKTADVLPRLKIVPRVHLLNSESIKPNIPTSEPLKSLKEKANNSIYKLSYAESLTDGSSSESRSVSPPNDLMDPKFSIPKSVLSDEINVYDGGSDVESGPEDLEMNPHVYESPHSNKSKHLYENELSLAVELLRTKENLPYDDEFKKIVENSVEVDNESENSLPPLEDCNANQCRGPSNMSVIINPFEELQQQNIKELDPKAAGFAEFEDGEGNLGFRRSAAQFIRHYFSPCAVDNCCIIM